MTKIPPEPTQKGNPYQLTIRQHVFPRACIDRFTGLDGRVEISDTRRKLIRRATPSDDIFCAKRAWDHGSENGYMRRLESDFQDIADKFISDPRRPVNPQENMTVSKLFALWVARSERRNGMPFQPVNGMVLREDLTQDQEEIIEKNGYIFMRKDGAPGRYMNGIGISMRMIYLMRNELRGLTWSPVLAREGTFIVPDVPCITAIPLTPTMCLMPSQMGTGAITNLAEINSFVRNKCEAYYFAQKLSDCPFV